MRSHRGFARASVDGRRVLPKEGGLSSYILIIYVVAFIAIFYFMAIRPQQRQRKAHQALLSSLQKGDTVVTAAGIYGKVKQVEDDTVVIEVAKGVNMRLARRAIVEIVRDKARIRELSPQSSSGARRGKRSRAQIEESIEDDYSAEEAESEEVVDAGEDESVETDESEEDDSV
jgi:preprotein translocase subunit YajC